MIKYDWKGVLTNQYHWVNIYKALKQWKPDAPFYVLIWLTIKFPHIHRGKV